MMHYQLIFEDFSKHFSDSSWHGITIRQGGTYLVAIDTQLTREEQERVLRHELSHIVLGHLEDDRMDELRQEREREADAYAERMTDEEYKKLLQYRM